MIKKIVIIKIAYLIGFMCNISATIIFTYKNPDDVLQYRVDFSTGSDRVDIIKNIGDDDFTHQGPFATDTGLPTGNLINNNLDFLYPSYDDNYLNIFYTTLEQPSPLTDMRANNFNLYSGDAAQLSSLVNDFDIDTDLFKPDPQLVTITEYYINGTLRITPGQRIPFPQNNCVFTIIRKDDIGFKGAANQNLISNLVITCPPGKRVEFDVSEIASLPSNSVTNKTKGCVITNQNVITAIS